MPSRRLVLVLVVFCFMLGAYLRAGQAGQQTDDEAAIRKVLEDYIVGWREADVPKLATVFDAEGRVMWLSGDPGSERLNTMTFAEILKRCRPSPDYGKEWRVESLDVLDGRLAVAKVQISRAGGHYVDYLALHKLAGGWRIVNKTFVMR